MPDHLPAFPYLAPWYRLARGPGKVVLEHGQRMVCLEGGAAERLLPALLPLLDGTRTVNEIVAVLGEPVRPAVEQALIRLSDHGVLVEGPPLSADQPVTVASAAHLLASLRAGATSPALVAAKTSRCSVGVAGSATVAVEVARLLRLSGAEVERVEGPNAGADLTVCAPSGAELSRLREWNEQALVAAAPWLQLLPFDGRYAAVGPLYLPDDTCCYECFRLRRSASLEAAEELPLLETVPATYPMPAALDAVVGGVAAHLALGWLVLGDHYVPAAFYALELLPSTRLSLHHVHRVPRCSACSGVTDVAPPLPWHKEIPVAAGG